jgi:eukaryotic-like serine/threonine-protein kinase
MASIVPGSVPSSSGQFEFGGFQLDSGRKVLWHGGRVLRLGPKVVQTLAVLVARGGEVVSREELFCEVWGNTVVEENSLAHNISVLRKVFKEDPSCAFTIETVPRRGYRFVPALDKCPPMEKDSQSPGLQLVAPPDLIKRPSNRWLWLAVAFGVLVCLGAASVRLTGYHPLAQGRHRRVVGVIGFVNLSHQADSAWLSTALAEMMTNELAAGGKFLTVPEESLARVRAELKLADQDGFSSETLGRLRQGLDADIIVSGAYAVLPYKSSQEGSARLRLDLRIQDAVNGETLDAVSEAGEQSSLFQLVGHAGARIREDLGLKALTQEQVAQARASMSSNDQAVRLYAQGTDKLRGFDALGARALLQDAVRQDPNYAAAHSALSEALSDLGYERDSQEEAKIAFELSVPSSREEQLSTEGRYRMTTREWEKAVEVHNRLLALSPDNLDYGLRLASAQIKASKVRDALETLEMFRRSPGPASDDPRISLKEEEAWRSLGDFGRMERVLEAAADSAKRHGALLLLARARIRQCWVQRYLAEQELALNNCRESWEVYSTVGDRRGEAVALRFLGAIVSDFDRSGADHYLQRALALDREIGSVEEQAKVINLLAALHSDQGDHRGAKGLYEQALEISQRAGDTVGTAETRNNVAVEWQALGKIAQARKMYEDTLEAAKKMGNEYLAAIVEYNIGGLEQAQGELDPAEQSYRQALAGFQKSGIRRYDITVNKSLGEIALLRGDLLNARRLYEQALSFHQSAEQKFAAAEAEMNLDELLLEQAQITPGVESSLRRILEIFHDAGPTDTNGALDDEAQTAALLARCLLSESRPADALKMAERAVKISTRAAPNVRLSVAVSATRVHYEVEGNSSASQALDNLRKTITEAQKFGYVGVELEARFAFGEIELKSGSRFSGRAHLQAVERDASRRGLSLLARKAKGAA